MWVTRLCLPQRFGLWLFCAALALASAGHALGPEDTQEDRAFAAACAHTEPEGRAAALAAFLRSYPQGTRSATARRLLLKTYLDNLPDHTGAIHEVAASIIATSAAGVERWWQEAAVALALADAGTAGVDLPDAARWATDAASAMTEAAYLHDSRAVQRRYGLPPSSPAQLRQQFARDRGRVLAAEAAVELRSGSPAEAARHLSEARRLDASSSEVWALLGETALATNQRQEALTSFVRAGTLSRLSPRRREQMVALYAELQHGDEAALEDHLDAAYRALYPAPFSLPRRRLPAGGHTALLELFTGSDCAPCTAPDLAVDSLLGSYTRSDLLALEFDEHIPRPDPLANEDSGERAAFYGVEATPTAFLDGQPIPLLGSARADVENVVVGLGEPIEDQAARPSGLSLELTTEQRPGGTVAVTTHLQVDRARGDTPESTGTLTLSRLQRLVVYTALAEDEVRFMGENGVRFHRMVVRALRQQPLAALLRDSTGHQSFAVAELAAQQAAYLQIYSGQNGQFGAFAFPPTPPIRPDHLVAVVWVQDPQAKQVLQSALAVIPSP